MSNTRRLILFPSIAFLSIETSAFATCISASSPPLNNYSIGVINTDPNCYESFNASAGTITVGNYAVANPNIIYVDPNSSVNFVYLPINTAVNYTSGSITVPPYVGYSLVNNDGSIQNLTTAGTINGDVIAFNFGLIRDLNNTGSLQVANWLANSGQVTNITNSGTVIGSHLNPPFALISNSGAISSFSNTGTMSAPVIVYNANLGSIGTISNLGTMISSTNSINNDGGQIGNIINSGTITNNGAYAAFYNTGTIGSITNNNSIASFAEDAIYNGNIINNITNNGTISAWFNNGIHNNSGTITNINNGGTISGEYVGVLNSGNITTINNSGVISGNSSGLANLGTISSLINTGTIRGGLIDIYNTGTIQSFKNASSVTYNGTLPQNYSTIVRSLRNYGQLNVTPASSATGIMKFSIAPESTLTKGTYTNILQGVGLANLDPSSISAQFGRYAWTLTDANGDNNWDLTTRLLRPDPTNTVATIQQSAFQVRNQINLNQAMLTSVLAYDSNVFGTNNVSISLAGRYTGIANENDQGAAALIAAYRLNSNMRVGAFIDYAPWTTAPYGLQQSGTQPTFGAFGVYEQNSDLVGINGRVSVGYGKSFLTTTRSALLTETEPGSGKASLTGFGAAAELSYGLRLNPQLVALPYIGVRFTDVARGSYTEEQTYNVLLPLSFNRYAQTLTTAALGLRLNGNINPNLGYFISAGAEYDITQNMGRVTGTSIIDGLETFSVSTNNNANRLRVAGAAGITYIPVANQKLTVEAGIWQQAYSSNPVITSVVKYTVGF